MYAISIQLAEEKFKFSHIKQENERLLEICGKLDANFEGHKGKVDAFLSPSDARASKFQDFEASMIEIESSYNYKIGELDKKFNNLMDGAEKTIFALKEKVTIFESKFKELIGSGKLMKSFLSV